MSEQHIGLKYDIMDMLRSLLLFILLFGTLSSRAQMPSIELMGDRDHIKIPFTYYYNFIIVEIRLAGVLPLKFILDTGAENTLIFDKTIADLIGTQYEREITIMGSDFTSEVKALIARRVPISIPRIGSTHADVIVLKENLYHLEQFIGTNIHGILGSNFFSGLVLEVDYDKEYFKIHRPDKFKRPKRSYKMPFTVQGGKPYIKAYSQCGSVRGDSLLYMLDTGAGISTMLHTNTTDVVNLPQNLISGNLGSGLGGFITGYIGRMEKLHIGPYEFNNLLATFQELDTVMFKRADIERNGIIGNQILSRFDLALDYAHHELYLHPNLSYDEEFQIDRSGIMLIASGANLNDYYIQDVLPESPADKVDLRAGDEIISINGWRVSFFTMGWVARRFQKEVGKKIKIKILRGEDKITKTFYLADLI